MSQKCLNNPSKKGWCNKPTKLQVLTILNAEKFSALKRFESTEVDRRTWIHVPSGTLWFTSSDTRHVGEIERNF